MNILFSERRTSANRTNVRRAATFAAALALLVGLSGCSAVNERSTYIAKTSGLRISGTLSAAGSSAQESAVSAWRKGFQTANPASTINYDPIGSGGGREQFISGGVNLAGSDAALEDDELAAAKKRCNSDIVEVPVYVSPIAIIFNLPGIDDLNLTAPTVGAIFEGTITRWDDAAIAADNRGVNLPSTRITAVHRSDDSGTTTNFTDYLHQASEGSWTHGVVESWPIQSGEAAEGTSGVVAAVTSGEGTIGYADASQTRKLSIAKVKVGEEFVAYTPEAAAAVLDASSQSAGRDATDIAIDVDRTVTEPGVYPIVLISYQIACQRYDDAEQAKLIKAWLTYAASAKGQDAAAKDAGSAPISAAFSAKIQVAIDTISAD